MFGLRREVLEGQVSEPEEIVAGLDAVTVEDEKGSHRTCWAATGSTSR